MTTKHEWVEDYKQFEAVLHALNPMPGWEREATLRAFQTFGFDDASTPGNDMAFSHAETGVMLRHDGDYVAIEFGDGDLRTAMGDLVHVLYQLGWRDAEVYHPIETISVLLNDIGMSIPANMDFDVKEASTVSEISSFSETGSLVDRSVMALHDAAGTGDLSDFVLGELASMGEELSELPRRSEHNIQPQGRAHAFHDEDQPIVPSLGLPAVAPAQAPSEAPVIASPGFAHPHAEQRPHETAEVTAPREASPIEAPAPRATLKEARTPEIAIGQRDKFTAGNTKFILQRPGQNIEGLRGEIVHLWPGAAKQPWRWNLLGEIDPAAPWFAEALTRALGFDNPAHAVCFEHGLRAWSQTEAPTLRGLIEEMALAEHPGQTFGSLLLLIDQRDFYREAVIRLAQLGVHGGSDGFVDCVGQVETFSVRALLVDPTERTVVIHVDETDGALVERLVSVLFSEAGRWAISSRAEQQSVAQRERAARAAQAEVERKEELAKRQQLALELTAQLAELQKSGIQLPVTAG